MRRICIAFKFLYVFMCMPRMHVWNTQPEYEYLQAHSLFAHICFVLFCYLIFRDLDSFPVGMFSSVAKRMRWKLHDACTRWMWSTLCTMMMTSPLSLLAVIPSLVGKSNPLWGWVLVGPRGAHEAAEPAAASGDVKSMWSSSPLRIALWTRTLSRVCACVPKYVPKKSIAYSTLNTNVITGMRMRTKVCTEEVHCV